MEPAEVEFLAERELVTIIPNFSENKICLISVATFTQPKLMLSLALVSSFLQGDFGPFNPAMHTQVPLWMAINLRQRRKCRIEPPPWLNVGV